jgi:hypothetical protein
MLPAAPAAPGQASDLSTTVASVGTASITVGPSGGAEIDQASVDQLGKNRRLMVAMRCS